MNDRESTEGRSLTTEQIASAGSAGDDRPGPGPSPHLAGPAQAEQAEFAEQATAPQQAVAGRPAGNGDQPRAQLLDDAQRQAMLTQWKEIQAKFVDEPRAAVQDADSLVAEFMQRLAQMFASERQQLESRWAADGDGVSTEDLRHSLRQYRSFFERLLAA
jgi:hypothetical protein